MTSPFLLDEASFVACVVVVVALTEDAVVDVSVTAGEGSLWFE